MIVKRIEHKVKRMLNVEWETQKNGENKRHQKGTERTEQKRLWNKNMFDIWGIQINGRE